MDKNILAHKPIIGKISASWCGHCIELKPIWDTVLSKNPKILFIDIEKEGEDEKNELLKINKLYLNNSKEKLDSKSGYPTIFKIQNEKLEHYKGYRTESAITKWINDSINSNVGGKRNTIKRGKRSNQNKTRNRNHK